MITALIVAGFMLVCDLPISIWDSLDKEQQEEVMKHIAKKWMKEHSCQSSHIEAHGNDDKVEFYIQCKEFKV